jgi:hypothetical protein
MRVLNNRTKSWPDVLKEETTWKTEGNLLTALSSYGSKLLVFIGLSAKGIPLLQ